MRFKFNLLFIALLIIAGAMSGSNGSARRALGNTEKSLDIERYPNEPLELVDIKIGDQSIKAHIESKFRRDGEGLDAVKFEAENGWFKHVNVRLRNVSGKTINGFRAHLYFKPPDTRNMFSLPLVRTQSIKKGPLAPGEEMDVTIDSRLFDGTMETIRQNGADADVATVILAIESAVFSDEQEWYRGNLLRKDPDNPLKRIPVKPA